MQYIIYPFVQQPKKNLFMLGTVSLVLSAAKEKILQQQSLVENKKYSPFC
jgi:hypothetical protein